MSNQLITNRSCSRPPDQVLIGSALASTLGVLVTQPLDVLKTRLQGPPILSAHSSVGVFKTATALWSEVPSQNHLSFRLRAFWAGTIPSLWRSVPGVCAYFSTINLLQPYLSSSGSPSLNSFSLGFTSRCIVGTVLLPFTVVKAQAEAGLSQNRSTFEALRWIYKTTKLKDRTPPEDIPTYLFSLCAFFAAFCATAVTQPADVLRSNRQLSITTATHRTPWTQVLRETVRIDGITGPWRGFYLRLTRRSIFAVITWTLFDKILISSQSPLPTS
ncbi:unnamed protein product [Rodentolepis nana]|uniref:Mitochondrial thiamine pyrophosphate carrier 1 n=1 Tax=Rodentolepis nana TaxID=102285 RepID=A0A0R3TRZ5_RODNA|nr:unnamed protein product [Rodentolepis nana]